LGLGVSVGQFLGEAESNTEFEQVFGKGGIVAMGAKEAFLPLSPVRPSLYPYGMGRKRSEPRVATSFDSKALIVGQVWGQHKDDEELADFFAYNDVGVPLAFAFAEGIVNHTPTLEKYINETFDLLLEALNIEDAGFDDYHDLMDALEALERHNNPNPIIARRAGSTVTSVISLKNLTLKKRFNEKELISTETFWKKQDPYDHESWKETYAAGDPTTSQEILKSLLSSEEDLVKSLVLLNPNFPIQESASYCRDRFKVDCDKRFEYLSNLEEDEFSKIFDLDLLDLDEDEIEGTRGLLSWIQGEYFDEISFLDSEEVHQLVFDAGLIFVKGNSDQRQILEDLLPNTYAFFKNLSEKQLISPFLFWTLEVSKTLNNEQVSIEFDTRVLALEDAIHDPGEVNFLQYPSEFKPLSDLSSDMIINIEGGKLGVTNRVWSQNDEDVEFSSVGYEAGSGEGDGYYPTIPFFDSLGNLQVITTFFTQMGEEAEQLEQNLMGAPWDNASVFGNRIPIKLGYLRSSGSLFFGDSGSIQNGPGKDSTILEFQDLPEEEYLVVKYIDTSWSARFNQNTWAVSVLRDRAKRNYEILFEIFPELTNRQDDF
jgi:hypothetical protein